MDKYQKYSAETILKDLFEAGYVEKSMFQRTYRKSWYMKADNTIY